MAKTDTPSTGSFGKISTGEDVQYYILKNKYVQVSILDLGCTIQSIKTTDNAGVVDDVLLGYHTALEYETNGQFCATIVGRNSNRIANGILNLNDQTYHLAKNNGENNLHGGIAGWDKKIWKLISHSDTHVVFSHFSPDGDENFPCDVQATVTYILDENTLKLQYLAKNLDATRDTIVNMTNHAYWNLSGSKNYEGNLHDHHVRVYADHYIPVSDSLIPTGEIAKVENTPFDLRNGAVMTESQLAEPGNGYDLCYAFGDSRGKLQNIIEFSHVKNGRSVLFKTTAPGAQFYTCNFLKSVAGKDGCQHMRQGGLAVESQVYPDAPNQPHFPSSVLKAGEIYKHAAEFSFYTKMTLPTE